MDIKQYIKASGKSYAKLAIQAGYRGSVNAIRVKLFKQANGHTPISPQEIVSLRKASGGKITIDDIAGIKRKVYDGNGYTG